ncbi:MAG: hypothetical protein ACR2NB_11250 [Solirubrobacteraceae bacterium]
MTVATRLAAFALLLGLAFGGAALAGAAIDAPRQHETPQGGHDGHGRSGTGDHGETGVTAMDTEHGHDGTAADGVAVSEGGYTLEPERRFVSLGQPARFAFRILDARGDAVRDGYQLESDRELHLIVVRRDLRGYQHLHPARDSSGTWSTELNVPEAGVYRVYADFEVRGEHHTLATDVFVRGDFQPRPLPAAELRARADGYQVALRTTGVRAGSDSALTFDVTQDGRPVAELQSYLGTKGHLVALREGDLAYLHVHPDEAKLNPSEIRFMAAFPSAGRYRLFLQFRAAGRVHTVAYTLEVPR